MFRVRARARARARTRARRSLRRRLDERFRGVPHAGTPEPFPPRVVHTWMRRALCLAAALSIHSQAPAPATPSQVPPPPSAVSDRPASALSPSAPRPTIPIATDNEAVEPAGWSSSFPILHLGSPAPPPSTLAAADATAALVARMEPPPVFDNGRRAAAARTDGAAPAARRDPADRVRRSPRASQVADAAARGSAPPVAGVPTKRADAAADHAAGRRVSRESEYPRAASTRRWSPSRRSAPPRGRRPRSRPRLARHVALDRHARRSCSPPTARPRLPQATEFTVDRPRGHARAPSATRSPPTPCQKFATPPVAVTGTYPQTPLRPDSAIAIVLRSGRRSCGRVPQLLAIDNVERRTAASRSRSTSSRSPTPRRAG